MAHRRDRRPHSRREAVKRLTWIAILLVGAALFGCTEKADPEPQQLTATEGEETAYQTAAFAKQRAKWESMAEQGDAEAQRQLGFMYYNGQGIDVDYAIAEQWLSKAADQGDAVAQYMLGIMYVEGQGVPQSDVNAHMWFDLAARQDNSNARLRLERLAPEMSPEAVAEAKKLADEWKPTF
jgi:TPR repeat protein